MTSTNQSKPRKPGMYKAKIYNPKTDYHEYKVKLYEPPPYKDPLREKPREYKGNFKIPEYKPFVPKPLHVEYREYHGPTTDPLTGKPYKRDQREKSPKEEKIVKEEEKEEEKTVEPTIEVPMTFGDTTGSTKRSFQIYDGFI